MADVVSSKSKRPLGVNVYEAAIDRLEQTFRLFPKVCLSFSGGKDSTVMLHLAAEVAQSIGAKFSVLIIDLEAQYQHTIEHMQRCLDMHKGVIEQTYWVCLPISLRNAVSVYEPKWICWDEKSKKIWVRNPPKNAITNEDYFPFFRYGMEFEDFVPEFAKWFSDGLPAASLVGIRTDESLNRWRTIASTKKQTLNGRQWTTRLHNSTAYNVYPIYDWQTRDIWIYHAKNKDMPHNEIYDLMHKAGLSMHQQRLCQPYGDDQRAGLWLYQALEPDTWAKVVARVAGVNSGKTFVQFNGNASGRIRISKPDNHTWRSYASLLLETMPAASKEHYQAKIFTFLRWWEERGYPNGIPDEMPERDENQKKVPSWRRICKMLLRNDYWATTLSFTQTKEGYFYKRYLERKKREREELRKENMRKYGRIV